MLFGNLAPSAELTARTVFGERAHLALPFMKSFEASKAKFGGSGDRIGDICAIFCHFIVKCMVDATEVIAGLERRQEQLHTRLDGALDGRDGYRAKVDKVDAAMEQLLGRFGLVCRISDDGLLTLERKGQALPAPRPGTVVNADIDFGAVVPIKKKRGGWPKGKKRAPERKAAAKVKPVKKKARRKSK